MREDLYDEPEIEKVYPTFANQIRDAIKNAGPRPSESPAYQDLSLAIQRAVHPTTKIDPKNLGSRLRQAARQRREGRQARGPAVSAAAPAVAKRRRGGPKQTSDRTKAERKLALHARARRRSS